jgi:hypothetical protein
LPPEEVSFWYLANRLGHRFLREVEQTLGALEALGPGLWRCRVLRRLVFWVSSIDLPVEEESLPLHVVGHEPAATERQVAWLVVERPGLQERYGGWLASLHPAVWKEIEAMARTAGKDLKIDLRPMIKSLGLEFVLEQAGPERVVEQLGPDRVIKLLGKKELIRRIGVEEFLANLSAAERRELKRRLR